LALTFDFTAIEDSENVCFIEAPCDIPMDGISKGDRMMNPVTNTLIWSTIAVDLPGITAENCGEFFARLRFVERLDGAFLIRAEVDGKRPEGAAAFITEEEVLAHVGLKCNVSPKTRAQWLKRFTHDLDRSAFRFETKRQELKKAEIA